MLKSEKKLGVRSLVPALDQGIRVLFFLRDHAGEKMTLTMICHGVGISISKGHYILTTLHSHGLVEKDIHGKTYTLGARVLPLARAVLDHIDYRTVSAPLIQELSRETRATVWFCLRANGSLFILSQCESEKQYWSRPMIGHTFSASEGARGEVILAFVSDEERDRVTLLQKGRNTKKLLKDLEVIRRLGFAHDFGELANGVRTIASPVFGSRDQLLAILLLIGTFPKKMVSIYGIKTAETARQLSQKLGS